MSNIRARAIIVYDNSLILIKRIKYIDNCKNEYYVFPGGGIEYNESIEDCVKREAYEELGIYIEIVNQLYVFNSKDSKEYYYLCKYVSGTLGTGSGPEFTSPSSAKGLYIPTMLPIQNIKDIKLYPTQIRDSIIEDLDRIKDFRGIECRVIKID